MKFKLVFIAFFFMPLMVKANQEKICLGDTYEAVKAIKGFPEKVTFINVPQAHDNNKKALKFEAVSFYHDELLYIFESKNSRLCLISNGENNSNNIACSENFDRRQCI